MPVTSDENVRRLEVAMNDEARMRMRHCVEHLQEESDAILLPERASSHVCVDRLSVHVLEHEVRLTARTHARIEQPSDPRMGKAREHRSLVPEPLPPRLREQLEVEQFHRCETIEAAVAPASEPDRPSAALTKWALQRPPAELEAGERDARRPLEEACALNRVVPAEQRCQLLRNVG